MLRLKCAYHTFADYVISFVIYYITRLWFKKKYFHPYLGKIPILTNIFQTGWNHQLDDITSHNFRFYHILASHIVPWICWHILMHHSSGHTTFFRTKMPCDTHQPGVISWIGRIQGIFQHTPGRYHRPPVANSSWFGIPTVFFLVRWVCNAKS